MFDVAKTYEIFKFLLKEKFITFPLDYQVEEGFEMSTYIYMEEYVKIISIFIIRESGGRRLRECGSLVSL